MADSHPASSSNSSPSTSPTSLAQTTTTTNPNHPFYTLPAELILDIIDLLPPESFINFAFANYPLLHTHNLAPSLSPPRVRYITTQTQLPAMFPLLRMPPEIVLQVLGLLRPLDVMRFVVANYQVLERQGIAPVLGEGLGRELWGNAGVG